MLSRTAISILLACPTALVVAPAPAAHADQAAINAADE